MTIPAYHDAKDDLKINRGVTLTVYLHLLDALSPTEWSGVKQLALCSRLKISNRQLRHSLNLLTSNGYLEREVVQSGQPRRYRLVYKRMP